MSNNCPSVKRMEDAYFMKVSELMETLNKMPSDMEVLMGTGYGTLMKLMLIGTIEVIPSFINTNLLPGNEWRVPTGAKDEPETAREKHIVIT